MAELLASSFTSSVLDLQQLAVAALLDQDLHSTAQVLHGTAQQPSPIPTPPPNGPPNDDKASLGLAQPVAAPGTVKGAAAADAAAAGSSTAPSSPSGSTCTASRTAEEQYEELASELLVVAGAPASPNSLHHLELVSVVGGLSYVYVYCRVVSAALWRRYFETGACPGDYSQQGGEEAAELAAGGRAVRRLVLEAGPWAGPAGEALGRALGEGALVERDGGWVPDLYSPAFQDIELLG